MPIIHDPQFTSRLESQIARTDRSSGCWIWQGTISRTGYGQMRLRDEATLLAHRLSYEFHVGPIPAGMCVLHRCDNRRCINPDHLFLGTKGDNNRDRSSKGRSYRQTGAAHYSSKLTDDDVLEMRELRRKGVSLSELSKRFGIVQSRVSTICNRKAWTHVE